jgi:3-phosphoshikimate 1-carboxyvinyltransferase
MSKRANEQASKGTMAIQPVQRPLRAAVRVPGSKSLTNRALLVAALAGGDTRLTNALFSDDAYYFAEALRRLGFTVRLEPDASQMTVTGLGGRIPASQAELYIGNAGTAARFLTALLTLGRGSYTLDGDERMRQRPMGDLVRALSQLGAVVQGSATSESILCPPVRVQANGLPGGQAMIAGDVSSQFISGLLMVAPYAHSPVELRVAGKLSSKPYVDMTLAVMADFGVRVERHAYERFIVHLQHYRSPGIYPIESDASAASYFFAAPAICGGTVRVEGVSRRSKQGDVAFVDVLAQMGCMITEGPDWIAVTGGLPLNGVDVDLSDLSDTAQTLAAVAPFAHTPTTIRGIASARLKETDRVTATCVELARLGVPIKEHSDGMTIFPCKAIRPATIHTYNDHRMAMSFALIGLKAPGIAIADPGCVTKTFPNFFTVLDQMSA